MCRVLFVFCLFVGIFCVCIWHLVLFKYLFFTLIFRGTCCFGFGIKFFVVGYFVVHNRMHKYPIELIVSILLHETDWCYIGRHPRNSSDDWLVFRQRRFCDIFFLPLFARWNRSFDLLIVLDYTSISHEELHSANRCASCWGKKATSGSSQYINPISSYCIISRFKLQTMRWFEQFVHVV